MTYYGIIKEIVELKYEQKGNVILFNYAWVDNRVQDKWVKTDQLGVTTMNFKHLFNSGEKESDELFILASQAIQVFYVPTQLILSGFLFICQSREISMTWIIWRVST